MPVNHHPVTRRDFLKAGAAAAVGGALVPPSLGEARTLPTRTADAVIWINLIGGPSQLDTFDPKPNAPSGVRGPFRPTQTKVPGLHLSELFPKIATMADRFSLVRSMNHNAAPVHETGLQLLQTGRLFRDGPEWPNMGAVVSHLYGKQDVIAPWMIFSETQLNTGMSVGRGQGFGFLPINCDSLPLIRPRFTNVSDLFCHASMAMAHQWTRFLSINMFSTVFDAVSWDCHADGGSLRTTLADYRDQVAPMFDTAFSALLADLESRGQLDRTLVVATGEFGRTPYLNANGGRDHWPACWTAILAGGGVQGGRLIGASDAIGAAPADRPVSPQELVATVYHALGIAPETLIPGPMGTPVPVIEAKPVLELF